MSSAFPQHEDLERLPCDDPRMDGKPEPEPTAAQDVPGAQALLRGIDLLLAIGTAPAPPRFRDLERTVNIPRASLHRILAALTSRNLVRYDERSKTYEVGMRILDLSRRTLDKSGIIRAAKPEVARLARRLQRTVCLAVLDGADVFVLDFEDFDSGLGRLVRSWPRAQAIDTSAFLDRRLSPRLVDPEFYRMGLDYPAGVIGFGDKSR